MTRLLEASACVDEEQAIMCSEKDNADRLVGGGRADM